MTDPASRRDEPVVPPHDTDMDLDLPSALRAIAGAVDYDLAEIDAAALRSAAARLEVHGEPGALAEDLLAYSRAALRVAERLAPENGMPPDGRGADALAWVRASHQALAARKVADEPLEEGERAAVAAQIKALRASDERHATALGKTYHVARELVAFLETLMAEFDSADTHGSNRLSGRIGRKLAEVVPEDFQR